MSKDMELKNVQMSKLNFDDGKFKVTLSFPAVALNDSGSTINDFVKFINNDITIKLALVQQDLFDKKKVPPEEVKAPSIIVDIARLKKDGDIFKNLGELDQNKCKVSEAFVHDDMLFVAYHKHMDDSIEAYQLIPANEYKGDKFKSLSEKDKLPKKERRPFFKGLLVSYNKRKFVMDSPVVFCAKKATRDKTTPTKKSTTKKQSTSTAVH